MSFKFVWAHPAQEVFVTGSFDGWSKSVQLDKKGDVFEKTVPLPHVVDKIIYKFVADGQWIHDHTAKTETDHEGNVNNVLYPSDIVHDSGIISSVAPGASTAAMAAEQPLTTSAPGPGAFPVTPGLDEQAFSVNPIPASAGNSNPIKLAAGEPVPHPSTISTNDINSGVHDDPELKAQDETIAVAPIPATGGIGNPITLAPGEPVPHSSTVTSHDITSNVKLDKESYEKADALPPVLPPILGSTSVQETAPPPQDIGSAKGTVIPESGLPMGISPALATENVGPTTSSVAPTSTTATLAGAVPLEPRGVPEIIDDSQEAAGVDPEASNNRVAVAEKSQVEDELKSKVPEAPATSTSGTFGKSEAGIVGAAAGGLAAAGTAIGAAIYSVAPTSTTAGLAGQVPVEERGVPEVVTESQQEAHAAPEASANPEAVAEKSQVEKELQAAVPKAPATAESGVFGKSEAGVTGAIAGGVAAATAAVAGGAAVLRQKTKETTGTDPVSALPTSVQQKIDTQPVVTSATITNVTEDTGVPRQFALGEVPKTPGESEVARQTATTVPDEVVASQKEAHASPEASANAEAVREKSAVERELLAKLPTEKSQGEPAPSEGAALSETAPTSSTGAPQLNPIAAAAPIDLGASNGKENTHVAGDVSPFTKVDESASRVPNDYDQKKRTSFMDKLSGTPDSSKSDADGKKKRRSFFGKLKDKLSSKS